MKSFICIALLSLFFALPYSAKAGDGEGKNTITAYIFGVGVSHTDSTVYISEIQQLDEALIEKKTGFLNRMPDYSEQYRSMLRSTYPGFITCSVFYGDKAEKVEKKRAKLLRHYARKKSEMKIVEVPAGKFSFTLLHAIIMTKSETVPVGVGPAYLPK